MACGGLCHALCRTTLSKMARNSTVRQSVRQRLTTKLAEQMVLGQALGNGLRIAPGVAALGQQFVRRHRSPGSRGIKFLCAERPSLPRFADRVNDAPGGFHFVTPDEQR